jgi:hypothetical protein
MALHCGGLGLIPGQVVAKVALGPVFSKSYGFSCQIFIPPAGPYSQPIK